MTQINLVKGIDIPVLFQYYMFKCQLIMILKVSKLLKYDLSAHSRLHFSLDLPP